MDGTKELTIVEPGQFSLAHTDGVAALKQAEALVRYLADKCDGPQFIAKISGKKYPKVEWWTTVGAGFGLFPVEESCIRLEREEEIAYEAVVSVRRAGEIISRGSALCSSKEKSWSHRDEYAVRSMAVTRATGKAYRIAFSFLAVMAGLEGTPAEEMPEERETPRTVTNGQTATKQKDPDRQLIIDQIGQIVKDAPFTDADRELFRREIAAAKTTPALREVLDRVVAERSDRWAAAGTEETDRLAEEGWRQNDGGVK